MSGTAEAIDERVVLLGETGEPIGSAPKYAVHDADTALHLAFSCHVVRSDGQVLVTRRALGKRTWPGVWTNSFCGHPLPAESPVDAVLRRAKHELGLALDTGSVDLVLPQFRYRAVDASGVVENEVCPVSVARCDADPVPNPDEVAEFRWVDPTNLSCAIEAAPWAFSPWLVLQARELELFRG